MFRPNKNIEKLFESKRGNELYSKIKDTIEREQMASMINAGVLVGFSGGADSVFLLSFLSEYKQRENLSFPIVAVHVNHCIRGEEADRDEEFSRSFASSLGIEFISRRIDVPHLKKECGIGLEEAARNARYSAFNDIIEGRNDISTIAVAHNLSDNTETVLMNILRGTGLVGLCGIKPVRENIVRPIISVSKSEIIDILDEFGIQYVTDSTNLSSDYTRNYVRNEIIPRLHRLSNSPETSFGRMISNLRDDLNYLESEAQSVCDKILKNEKICVESLRQLHPAMFYRVITALVHRYSNEYPEEKHIHALHSLIKSDNFAYSLPGDKNFVCERGICSFMDKKAENKLSEQIFSLHPGENNISGTNLTVYIGEIDKSSLNVYNFSIQVELSSAIIGDSVNLRFRSDGDSYRYSGITHKLKKVFNDRNIPSSHRDYIPILCDADGIVYVPGLSIRDGAKSNNPDENTLVTFAYSSPKKDEIQIYTALMYK